MTTPRELVEQAYPDPSVRSTVLLQLAESLIAADTISPGCWSVSFRQNQIRLNVGRLEMLVLRENRLDMTIDRDATDEAQWTHIRANLDIEFKWNGGPFSVIRSAYGLMLPAARIEELLPRLRPLHLALVPRAAGTVQTRLPYYKAHDPEVMAYLRQEVAEDLPDPDYGVTTSDNDKAGRRFWKISAGVGGDHWDEFREHGWIAVNWTGSPDLRTLDAESPHALQERLNSISADQSFSAHAAKQLWMFRHEMTPGNRVCGYGSSQVLGWGEIIGDYYFDEEAHDFPHRRDVAWESTEPIHTSTLPVELADKLKQNTTIIELTEAEFDQITGEDTRPGTGYWWVNQRKTYKQELAGGYLWAPLKGKRGQVQKYWTDMTKLRTGELVIHYADGAIRAVGHVREPAVEAPRPDELPADPWADHGYFARLEYSPLEVPIRLDELPVEWRQPGARGPFQDDRAVKQGYLFPLSADFVVKLFEQFADRLPVNVGPGRHAQQRWLFQANPNLWNLAAVLEDRVPGDSDDWSVSRFRDEMGPGQPIVLWQAGERAGIYAIGELTDVAFERPTGEFWPDRDQRAPTEWAVPFTYTQILSRPILKSELLSHPVLKDLSVIRGPMGTNFKVTARQWDAIQEIVSGSGVASPVNWWIEKTQQQGRPDRMQGDLAVGRALAEAIRPAAGSDLYENMRQIQPNDIILHFLTEQRGFTGRSRAAGSAEERDTPPNFRIMAERTLVVPLKDYLTLDPPLPRDVLFAPQYAERLKRLLDEEGTNTFYRADPDLRLNAQTWVTPASAKLVAILQDAYRELTDQDLVPQDWDPIGHHVPPEPLASTLEDLAAATHLDRAELMELEALLDDKRQLVLEGPPGSGKTYLAERFARYFAGLPLQGDPDERVETVQFHQSYGYEDFVQGIRPVTDEHGQLQYHVLPGIFMRMCDLAARNPEQRFVLIIDEINRGNLSRIFGELLLLLEYRDKRVRLPYGVVDGKDAQAYLSIPRNLYLIGTMNSTDRSLALIDYALRRRFYFYRLLPVVDGHAAILDRWFTARGVSEQDRQRVVRLFVKLNQEVERLLGSEFQIGHSYFMRDEIGTEAEMDRLWRRAIMPLLEEYLHGARDRELALAELAWRHLLAAPVPELEPPAASPETV